MTDIQPDDYIITANTYGRYEMLQVQSVRPKIIVCGDDRRLSNPRVILRSSILVHTSDKSVAEAVMRKLQASVEQRRHAVLQAASQHDARVAKIIAEARS